MPLSSAYNWLNQIGASGVVSAVGQAQVQAPAVFGIANTIKETYTLEQWSRRVGDFGNTRAGHINLYDYAPFYRTPGAEKLNWRLKNISVTICRDGRLAFNQDSDFSLSFTARPEAPGSLSSAFSDDWTWVEYVSVADAANQDQDPKPYSNWSPPYSPTPQVNAILQQFAPQGAKALGQGQLAWNAVPCYATRSTDFPRPDSLGGTLDFYQNVGYYFHTYLGHKPRAGELNALAAADLKYILSLDWQVADLIDLRRSCVTITWIAVADYSNSWADLPD